MQAPVGVVEWPGLAEHAGRYDRLAQALTAAGFVVHATDHRGHGKSISGVPGDFGDAGFEALVADVAAHGASGRSAPGLPLFLVAHSMGSFAAQSVLLTQFDQYCGVVLSGSTALAELGAAMAAGAQDPDAPAGLEAFARPATSSAEWLSRDGPGGRMRRGSAVWFRPSGGDGPGALQGRRDARRPPRRSARACRAHRIRRRRPARGWRSPRGGALGQRYRVSGLTDVTVRLYEGARHEIFNETNSRRGSPTT